MDNIDIDIFAKQKQVFAYKLPATSCFSTKIHKVIHRLYRIVYTKNDIVIPPTSQPALNYETRFIVIPSEVATESRNPLTRLGQAISPLRSCVVAPVEMTIVRVS